jgi:hypothetical protein
MDYINKVVFFAVHFVLHEFNCWDTCLFTSYSGTSGTLAVTRFLILGALASVRRSFRNTMAFGWSWIYDLHLEGLTLLMKAGSGSTL